MTRGGGLGRSKAPGASSPFPSWGARRGPLIFTFVRLLDPRTGLRGPTSVVFSVVLSLRTIRGAGEAAAEGVPSRNGFRVGYSYSGTTTWGGELEIIAGGKRLLEDVAGPNGGKDVLAGFEDPKSSGLRLCADVAVGVRMGLSLRSGSSPAAPSPRSRSITGLVRSPIKDVTSYCVPLVADSNLAGGRREVEGWALASSGNFEDKNLEEATSVG